MATVVATSSLQLTPEKQKEVVHALEEAVGTMFKAYSIYYVPIPQSNVSEGAKNQTTFYVFVPPTLDVDRRRQMIKLLTDVMIDQVGYQGELKNIVIFKYHDDEACGVDGVLRADAKK